jgi:hypothetical protein
MDLHLLEVLSMDLHLLEVVDGVAIIRGTEISFVGRFYGNFCKLKAS